MNKFKITILFIIAVLITLPVNAFANFNPSKYVGVLADNNIHMQLFPSDNGKLNGTYYYDAFQQDIMLDGYMTDNGAINLIEYDEYGTRRATFKGVFVTPDAVEGVWIDRNINVRKEKPLQFFLVKEDTQGTTNDTPINENWNGVHKRDGSSFTPANIEISYNTGKSFWFVLSSYSGANTGLVSGVALINGNTAIYSDNNGGILNFELNNGGLTITQNYKMSSYAGLGVYFAGNYLKGELQQKSITLADLKVLTPSQEDIFKELVNDHYQSFTKTAQMVSQQNDLDGFGARVYTMGVRGLFTILESIIMVRDDGKIWAAVIEDGNVYYFTNTNRTKALPLTIEKWRERFINRTVIYPDN